MAPRSKNPNASKGKSKATAEEKGKRPIDVEDTFSPSPPKKRTTRRGPGIHIGEGITSSADSFRSELDARKFSEKFANRRLAKNKAVDFAFFEEENFGFPKWLRDYGLHDFLTIKEAEYEDLLRLFCFYLQWDENAKKFSSYVKGVFMSFTLKELAEILKLPYDSEDELSEIPTSAKIEFLTRKSNLPDAAFFTRELKCIDYRVLFNVICHCIYPRAGGFDKVNLDDIEVLFAVISGLKMSLVQTMGNYMMDQKLRKNGYLPFSMILTRLFKHFKVDLKKEKSQEATSYSVIKDSTLKRMRISKQDGRWVSKMHDLQEEEEHEEVGQEQQGAETGEAFQEQDEGQAGFDNFPMEDLLGSSSPLPTHPEIPIPPSTSTPQPSSSTPFVPTSIDFSPILDLLASQFSQINSNLARVESKVDQTASDLFSFKQEVSFQLSNTQEKLELIDTSFGIHCPNISHTLDDIKKFLNLHFESLRESIHGASIALKDMRDNTDRVCLDYRVPFLPDVLEFIKKHFAAEFEQFVKAQQEKAKAKPPPASPPFPPKPTPKSTSTSKPKHSTSKPKHSTSKPKPYKPRKAQKTTAPPTSSTPVQISDESESSYDPDDDPYADKVRSESE